MQIRKRVFIGIATFAFLPLLATGCAGDDETDHVVEPALTRVVEGETSPVITPIETVEPSSPGVRTDGPPETTASSSGTTVEMGIGTYCWTNLCVDKIGPITRGTLSIASGDEVLVEIPDGTPALREVSVIAFPASESQEVDNGETARRPDFDQGITLVSERDEKAVRIDGTLEPGKYVLTVGMFFEPGDVQYGVVLEVQ